MTTNQGQVIWAGLMPHPPIVVPGVGRGRERDAGRTCDAMTTLAQRVASQKPNRLVVISPHSPRRRGMFGVWHEARHRGNLGQFGAPDEAVDLPNDVKFAETLKHKAREAGLVLWDVFDEDLDHGAIVPLCYFRDAGWKGPTVIIGLNYPGEGQLMELGHAIAQTAELQPGATAVLASGDMSHRLIPNAPGGYHPQAHKFDEYFISLVRAGDYDKVCRIPPELEALAGEDVIDSSLIALAAVNMRNDQHEVLNYEGPFGVGYGVAQFFSAAKERA